MTERQMEVLEVARDLGIFTAAQLAAELGITREWATEHIRSLIAERALVDTGERRKHGGPGRPAPVYSLPLSRRTIRAMRSTPTPTVNREKRVPVEVAVVKTARIHTRRGTEVRLSPAARLRRTLRGLDAEVRDLCELAFKNGCRISLTKDKHVAIRTPSGGIVHTGGTNSDWRSVANCRSELRQLGVNV